MNGMNDDTWSPAELIYLYLDGEADAAQHTALFAALAHDAELQTEFRDALQMCMSLAAEVRQTSPSPALKEALLYKAAATALPAEVAAPVSATTGTAGSVAAAVKAVLVPLLSVAAGTLIVAGRLFLPDPSPVEPSAATVVREPAAVWPAVPAPPASAGRVGVETGESLHSLRTVAPARMQPASHAEEKSMENATPVRELPPDEIPTPEQATVAIAPSVPMEVGSHMAEKDLDVSSMPLLQAPLIVTDGGYSWTLYGRGIVGVRTFPERRMGSADNATGNIAVGMLYSLNTEIAAGVEVGREALPRYLAGTDGSLEKRLMIEWAGVSGRYTPSFAALAGTLRPFVSGLVGATESGPLLKSLLGIHWRPNRNVGLSLGVEGTMLMYRHRQQWYGMQKIGASWGVELHL